MTYMTSTYKYTLIPRMAEEANVDNYIEKFDTFGTQV